MDKFNILLHTYASDKIKIDDSHIILESILSSGLILSKKERYKTDCDAICENVPQNRVLNKTNSNNRKLNGYNGSEYISLTDYIIRCNTSRSTYCAFNLFARTGPSILLDKSRVKYIKPIIIKPFENFSKNVHALGESDKRYTDLVDEVQVKDRIPLVYMQGIAISTKDIYDRIRISYDKRESLDRLICFIAKINALLLKYKYNPYIVDLFTLEELNDVDKVLSLIK